MGGPTDAPWAFVYTNPMSMVPSELLGVPLHPYPAYELLFDLALLGLLWKLRGVFKADGLLFLTYVGVYAIGRFLLTFFRVEQVWFFGLQEAQVASLLVLVATLPLLSWRLQAGRRSLGKQPAWQWPRVPTVPDAPVPPSRGRIADKERVIWRIVAIEAEPAKPGGAENQANGDERRLAARRKRCRRPQTDRSVRSTRKEVGSG